MREDRIIPLMPEQGPRGPSSLSARQPLPHASTASTLTAPRPIDRLGRPLRDLRISVTDRCNFRCGYCMPREVYGPGHRFMPHPELLSFEEIERSARIFLALGVHKLRLTGGEPLMRRDLPVLIDKLARLRTESGLPPELALTTNGALLAPRAAALRSAGLNRLTVSLDAIDDATFRRMSDSDIPLSQVLQGIEAAQHVGLGPLKVNMVVQRGVNDHQILPMIAHFRHSGIELRFIEFMDVGHTNGWNLQQVMPTDAVIQHIESRWSLRAMPHARPGDTAKRMALADGSLTLGFISSVTQAFCGDCNRLRLSTDGRLYTCLFTGQGHDLRDALRNSDDDVLIQSRIAALWQQRHDQYSALRGQRPAQGQAASDRVEMSFIGG